MRKIVYLPIDERPCNSKFPSYLLKDSEVVVKVPSVSMLGQKKTPADIKKIKEWLLENLNGADGLIISLDMLIYGGLVSSRTHHDVKENLKSNLYFIKEIKKSHPDLLIYGFQTIMRSPANSSGTEEPDYYEDFGKEIFTYGVLSDKANKNLLELDDEKEKTYLESVIPKEFLNDYLNRRKINFLINESTVELIKENYFDFFIFPQDDTHEYGYSALDRTGVEELLKKEKLYSKVMMYPGADEIGCTLLARMINKFSKIQPKVFLKFSNNKSKLVIPSYEDRTIIETIKSTVVAQGGIVTESCNNSDIIFMINAPSNKTTEAAHQLIKPHLDVEQNLFEFCTYMDYWCKSGKIITVADSYYANGGDLEFFNYLNAFDLVEKIQGYAGWNTNSNTVGTALAQGMIALYRGKCEILKEFLLYRYCEDICYGAIVRQTLRKKYYDSDLTNSIKKDEIENEANKMMNEVIHELLPSTAFSLEINNCSFPWNRMFEINFDIQVRKLNEQD